MPSPPSPPFGRTLAALAIGSLGFASCYLQGARVLPVAPPAKALFELALEASSPRSPGKKLTTGMIRVQPTGTIEVYDGARERLRLELWYGDDEATAPLSDCVAATVRDAEIFAMRCVVGGDFGAGDLGRARIGLLRNGAFVGLSAGDGGILELHTHVRDETVFLPEYGIVGDRAEAESGHVLLDDGTHPFAIVSSTGVSASYGPTVHTSDGGPMPLKVAARLPSAPPAEDGDGKPDPAMHGDHPLFFTLAASSEAIYDALAAFAGVDDGADDIEGELSAPAASSGATEEPPRLFVLDGEGRELAMVNPGKNGKFRVKKPRGAVSVLGARGATRASPVTPLGPAGKPLKIQVPDAGTVDVAIVDADSGLPVVARLLVRGLDGTFDPMFGPDFRASGAGPIVDSARGIVHMDLPPGRYRVTATKGVFYTIDSEDLSVETGKTRAVELRVRKAIVEPGAVSCDLHVHSNISYDSKVTVEDRVLSLVAAGIDFAVPTEHNNVGTYARALDRAGLSKDLAWVPGVEITTYSPFHGHFGIFPYPLGKKPPKYKQVPIPKMFKDAKANDDSRMLVVHHPHMMPRIGYFDLHHFNAQTWEGADKISFDFDGLEVMNGFELGQPHWVDDTLADWFAILRHGHRIVATGSSDSHRILYGWAGYPRTVALLPEGSVPKDPAMLDRAEVVAALKAGRSFVTDGPVISLTLDGKGPGETLAIQDRGRVRAHVRVAAAPWIDVTHFALLADGTKILEKTIPSRPLIFSERQKKAAEVRAESVRWEGDIVLELPAGTHFVNLVAKGERSLETVLPATPARPFAFTNPIWIAAPQ
jgi:hypothetical protein